MPDNALAAMGVFAGGIADLRAEIRGLKTDLAELRKVIDDHHKWADYVRVMLEAAMAGVEVADSLSKADDGISAILVDEEYKAISQAFRSV